MRLNFTPQAGHEQHGWRPALVLSPQNYNGRSGMALVCPVTSQVKGYPFETPLSPGGEVSGVVLADHLRSVDWRARGASRIESVPAAVVAAVLAKTRILL